MSPGADYSVTGNAGVAKVAAHDQPDGATEMRWQELAMKSGPLRERARYSADGFERRCKPRDKSVPFSLPTSGTDLRRDRRGRRARQFRSGAARRCKVRGGAIP